MATRSRQTESKTGRQKKSTPRRAQGKKSGPEWIRLSNEELLDVRICDLKLSLEGTVVERCLQQLHREMQGRGLRLKPHCWLSDDWFSPDGIPGIAVPFYMAHPRLKRLERNQMLEVEGGTRAWCMQILRHEAGHAMDTAFRLHRRKKYRECFGKYSDPYPESYKPKPQSKSYVIHLEQWYAQSHPSEDFAETFAVWLQPRKNWRRDYAGWEALQKIEYVDQLMTELKAQPPKVKSRVKVDPVSRMRQTLREHYAERLARYDVSWCESLDRELKKLFVKKSKNSRNTAAADFLRKNRGELCELVTHWTGEYQYNTERVLREMMSRCSELKLCVRGSQSRMLQNTIAMLTVHTMQNLNGGQNRVAL
ncbi:MAG: putative zinc-binding metallopeptidase [Planctomycetota bacterium]|nr:putative zinc-binding metallopeptidase [Planctomycetota bacterium]